MPIIESTYKPSFYFKNGFISTVYSGLVRRVSLKQERERITLKDGDFLDLDWSFSNSKSNKLIILLHGLEGNGQRPYMTGTANHFNNNGLDAVCINFRGCSGENNLKYYLKGFSLGGNIILKYLGEHHAIPDQVKASIAVSIPCDLYGSCKELHKLKNKLFHDRFLRDLVKHLKEKQKLFPEELSIEAINTIKTLIEFDTIYTSKAHGFKDALDYYKKSSSLQFLHNIKTPTLIINALNDSFLSSECYPVKEAKRNPNLYLEMPNYGGHAGFVDKKNVYYNEKRALEFINANF